MQDFNAVRPSPIAGLWYSDNANQLRKEIQSYLQFSGKIEGEVRGIIAPHAGYRYSGKTAGHAFFSVIGKRFDLVIIFSPLHAYHSAQILSTKHEAYQTTLGQIPVDRDLLNTISDDLIQNHAVSLVQLANDDEHSLEIELPFLQCALNSDFSILPLMVRTIEPQFFVNLAQILIKYITNKKILVVASTDLSHFYAQDTALRLDKNMLSAFERFSSHTIYQTERSHQGFACGSGAVMAAIELTKMMGANHVQVLSHTTSAEETGDFLSVVGYGAAIITKIDVGD